MIKIRASKCIIREAGRDEELAFLNENHYQGYVYSDWHKGLYYNGELIMLMTFGRPRFTNKYDWELIRLCTKKDVQVYGGASRLLKDFRSDNLGSIISYCNKDKFSGEVYDKLGFRLVRTTVGYHYEKEGKSYSRYAFQKKKCLELWPQYKNTNYTEQMIMKEQGYVKVLDKVGQATYILDTQECKYYIYEIEINGYYYIGQHKYTDTVDDDYYGSGLLIRRMQKKYGKGNKTILKEGITSQEEADSIEESLIKEYKDKYGEYYKHNGKCLNIRNNGQGKFGITYGTYGKTPCTSPSGNRHYLKKEDIPSDWTIGAFNKGCTHTEEQKAKMSKAIIRAHKDPNKYKNEVWNKGKKMPDSMNKQAIKEAAERKNSKIDEMIPEGWIRIKEARLLTGLAPQTILKRYECKVLMYGNQKVTIVKIK